MTCKRMSFLPSDRYLLGVNLANNQCKARSETNGAMLGFSDSFNSKRVDHNAMLASDTTAGPIKSTEDMILSAASLRTAPGTSLS